MPSVAVDPAKVHEFPDLDSFYQWLSLHHSTETEVWIKVHKMKSGLKTITIKEGIDAICKSFDILRHHVLIHPEGPLHRHWRRQFKSTQ